MNQRFAIRIFTKVLTKSILLKTLLRGRKI